VVHYLFRSYAYTENFDLVSMKKKIKCSPALVDPNGALVAQVSENGKMFLYNFGAITFFDVEEPMQKKFIDSIELKLGLKLTQNVMTEHFSLEVNPAAKPKIEFNNVILDKLTIERIEVLALTLAQSAAMEYYETIAKEINLRVMKKIERVSSNALALSIPAPINQIITNAMTVRYEINEVLHLLDKPDLVWDDPVMEGIYSDLIKMFDLSERYVAIEHRLKMAFETLDLLVASVRDKRMFLAEMAIVILIVFDIVMSFVRK
jgi:required for meiotic nuclear division protein 1